MLKNRWHLFYFIIFNHGLQCSVRSVDEEEVDADHHHNCRSVGHLSLTCSVWNSANVAVYVMNSCLGPGFRKLKWHNIFPLEKCSPQSTD